MVLHGHVSVLLHSAFVGLEHKSIFLSIELSGFQLYQVAFQNIFGFKVYCSGSIKIANARQVRSFINFHLINRF